MRHAGAIAVMMGFAASCSSIPRQRILSAQELGVLEIDQIRHHDREWSKQWRQTWDTLHRPSVWHPTQVYDDTWLSCREVAVREALERQAYAEFALWMVSRRRDVVFRGIGAPQGTNTPMTEVWISRIYVPVGARLREFVNAIEDAFAREVSWHRQVVDVGRLQADVLSLTATNEMRFQGNPQDCALVTRDLWNVDVRVHNNIMVFEPVDPRLASNEVFRIGVGFVQRGEVKEDSNDLGE